MKRLAFAIFAAIGVGNPSVSFATDKAPCAAAVSALREVQAQVTDARLMVLGSDDGDVRFALDRDHFADMGDPAAGLWGKAAPSSETAKLYLEATATPAVSACVAVRQEATRSGLRLGRKAERDAARLNRRQKPAHEIGAILSVQTPVLNPAEDEALVSVTISYPGIRAGSGWVYLLRRQTDGSWRLTDKQFAYAV